MQPAMTWSRVKTTQVKSFSTILNEEIDTLIVIAVTCFIQSNYLDIAHDIAHVLRNLAFSAAEV